MPLSNLFIAELAVLVLGDIEDDIYDGKIERASERLNRLRETFMGAVVRTEEILALRAFFEKKAG